MRLDSGFGHIAAIGGTLALHAGLAAWAMQPSLPIAIPQQQVIQVAMIAPKVPREETAPVMETPPPPIPPKPVGMKKAEPPKKAGVPKPPATEPEKPRQMAMLTPASGPQTQDAEAKNSAITQPTFEAAYLRNPPPAYPPAARRRNVQGKVLLKVDVSQKGQAEHVEIVLSSGSGLLDEAARKAVGRWRFIPARRGSEKVAADVTVPIIFKIEENR